MAESQPALQAKRWEHAKHQSLGRGRSSWRTPTPCTNRWRRALSLRELSKDFRESLQFQWFEKSEKYRHFKNSPGQASRSIESMHRSIGDNLSGLLTKPWVMWAEFWMVFFLRIHWYPKTRLRILCSWWLWSSKSDPTWRPTTIRSRSLLNWNDNKGLVWN